MAYESGCAISTPSLGLSLSGHLHFLSDWNIYKPIYGVIVCLFVLIKNSLHRRFIKLWVIESKLNIQNL